MTFNPAEPRDEHGRWTDSGGGLSSGSGSAGASIAHSSPGHNNHIGSVARSFLSGAIHGAKVSGAIGAGVGGLFGASAGPIGAATGVITGGVGGAVSGFVGGGTSRVIEAHPELFGSGRAGIAARMTLGVVGGVAGAFAGAAAGTAAGRTFYGGAKAGAFRESTDEERQRMAERMAAERARDPMERKLDALRAKAADRGIGDAERRAFQAKADELLKRHRAGPTTGRHVVTSH